MPIHSSTVNQQKKLPRKATLFYHVIDSNDLNNGHPHDLNTGNVRYSDAVGFSKLY